MLILNSTALDHSGKQQILPLCRTNNYLDMAYYTYSASNTYTHVKRLLSNFLFFVYLFILYTELYSFPFPHNTELCNHWPW